MYLYTGAADVGAAKGDSGYMQAMKTVWEDVVYRNMYVTGGIGSSGSNEGFSVDYDLPNEEAYSETCASVGMVFWNQRMNLLEGDSKYIDVLERSLYNGALDGLSLTGDHFFYGNPLASSGQHARREWFGTACCPSNISRLVASVGDYIYAKNESGIWLNLFIGNETAFELKGTPVGLKVDTDFPWDGTVKIEVNPEKDTPFDFHLRIPGWVTETPVPGNLYTPVNNEFPIFDIQINGIPAKFDKKYGYAVLSRTWQKGDIITYTLPLPVQELQARPEVTANTNRVALQRGPLVYCVEGTDNDGIVSTLILPSNAEFRIEDYEVLQEPVKAIRFGGMKSGEKTEAVAIPYYTWANRGKNEMQVWIKKD